MFGKVVNPRHMQTSALTSPNKINLVAKRYSDKNNINRDRNTKQKTGIISPDEAEEHIVNFNLNRDELSKGIPVNLGKRPFKLQQNPQSKQFSINRI